MKKMQKNDKLTNEMALINRKEENDISSQIIFE